jgi:hypothetical protein
VSLQRQVSLASVLKEMRDKIKSSSTKSEDEAGSDPKVDEPLSKGALEEAGLERKGDRLRQTETNLGRGGSVQEMEVDRKARIGSVQVKNLGIKPQVRSP